MRFLKKALAELGIEIEGEPDSVLRDGRLFQEVDKGELGTVIVWEGLPIRGQNDFHVGMMLDSRWALQSSKETNGVARVEINRPYWKPFFRGFYRPRQLCS